ncbi:2-dehydro-3-deoxy-6-phosphogalactonate aldolase [Phenylobacterium sp.]|uniref:2-dehydro-3-deoxy-6-phosphogalactonate aldolase n=1 Tax=Phenylobacterium sp. TaxID=1871053 RepID=UPI0025E977B4|nr:2-dehydro-3-deoxy-6-phosphogalactonate aldolase [Phenylobacterium sp.]
MKLEPALAACPIVAILRGIQPHEAVAHAAALFGAGIRALEVPLNSPHPLESVAAIAAEFAGRMAVGAGTVLTADQVEAVADVGGGFVVSPNTEAAVIRAALARGLEPVPGFATATEAFTAYAAGARRLKLFPAASYGVGHLGLLKAVLPSDAEVWAVGGVGPSDLSRWRDAGARAFGLGGELYRPGQQTARTAETAARAVAAFRGLDARA